MPVFRSRTQSQQAVERVLRHLHRATSAKDPQVVLITNNYETLPRKSPH